VIFLDEYCPPFHARSVLHEQYRPKIILPTMATVYFISDVHLGLKGRTEERAKEARLISFLDSIRARANQIFIVGDLFDAWFEYRTVIPRGFHRLLAKLDELTAAGIVIHYLAGNHDYWMRDYFTKELSIRTYHQPLDISIDGKRILVHHGDGLAHNDTGYRILKRILNNPVNIWLYSWIHPDIGLRIAQSSSHKSRGHTSSKQYGASDGMSEFAAKKIQEGYNIIVMGHRHQPESRQISGGTYINLGDWITHCTYAEMIDGQITLQHWPA
jgi:UDP-2,3-diacylglucosamine hydrolase